MWKAGLWRDNPGLVQLLGLCPLLAVTTSLVNGLGLGLATLFVLTCSNALVSATRRFIRSEIRIPMYVLIIASLVTCIELVFKAWFPALDRSLGIFIPLIVTNCIVLARVEAFAAKNAAGLAAFDGAMMGLGLMLVLVALGAIREVVGQGTLFAGIDMVFPGAQAWQVLPENYPGFLVAILPPGAFFVLGLLIAGHNWINARAARRARSPAAPAQTHAA
jgi:electron transport complex protein RnfE